MNQSIMNTLPMNGHTPAYVFDLDQLKEHMLIIQKTLGSYADICYAIKANPFLIQSLDSMVSRFEVCSPGEFHICERLQIARDKIVLSGVYKEKEEMQRILQQYGNSGIYTIESTKQLQILQYAAEEVHENITVLIRLTSGNQFGIDKEAIRQMIKEREEYPNLIFQGIQYYSGTQKKKMSKIQKELQMLQEFCEELQTEFDYEVQELEYGPGFYIPYFQTEEDVDQEKMLKEFALILEEMQFQTHLTLEMGRYIAAMCGYYFTSIVDQKRNENQNYCIVDGGIHHINYYGQTMAMKIPYYEHLGNGDQEKKWNICGSLCTVGDVLVKELPLNGAAIGDILVFARVGAYSVTEGISLFLSRDLPEVYVYSEKTKLKLLRERTAINQFNSEKGEK